METPVTIRLLKFSWVGGNLQLSGPVRQIAVGAAHACASNPRGDNTEGWHGDRYGAYHDHTRWTALVTAQGFAELEHYYRPPGQTRHLQPWLATIYRKT